MFTIVFISLLASAYAQQTLQVNITQGIVQGSLATDGNYYTFFGIHYAGSVSGANRFKAPTPAPSYPGVFHATENVICAQPTERGLVGDEDCLTLNIFTNNVTTPKPVIAWLVSDEYTNTEPVPSFSRLAREGLVIVQINYRLSIFGFLCLGVPEAPGNAGLKDVVQGLRWIQANIERFGGNPNNVILFGHGSGAAVVDLITLSPSATNLAHKAVALSGSALSPWAVAYTPIASAQAVGAKLNYTRRNNADLAQLLVNTDKTLLASALNDFELLNNSILFAPCIEDANLNDTFLTDAPINLIRAGNYSHIPYIAGYVDKEGTIRAAEAAYSDWLNKMQANFTNFLQVDLDFGANLTTAERMIREFYFSQSSINMATIQGFLDYQGDTLILVSVIRGARERALTSRSPVRLLGFEFRGTLNSDWSFTTIPLIGARHGAILNFLLDYDLRPIVDEPVMTSLVRRFVGFFYNGVPIQSVSPGPAWEPLTSSSTNYMLYSGGEGPALNTTIFTESLLFNPHQQRMTFWDDLYFRYYKAPTSVSSGVQLFGAALVVLCSQLFVRMF